ncbi:uncharacterized protein PGTG_13076 [Puccinia graminis f. sp. tritici CRL 75-36-700-3]|uniref:At2g23090-like zinc-binding domain-containing protein n=1 Tax=Puccinia graminis f. sp. tritici (strain CRL 75-36-700-3 / race SCCL) TaxID=418459 RepID=E3KQW9_PUCGT|nr:uncharacterized protein PGTG_13076 [Puccinia graminis f. sp. tritici CRL 75-36-700-3]EFP86694.2 hypothetical protein PGTG_13076 [Puccinia graminis f. sp. tritici CRL 75-36-700-3]
MHDPRTLGSSPPKRRSTSWKNSPVEHLQSSPPPSQNRTSTDHIEQAIIWKTSCSSSEPTVRHLPPSSDSQNPTCLPQRKRYDNKNPGRKSWLGRKLRLMPEVRSSPFLILQSYSKGSLPNVLPSYFSSSTKGIPKKAEKPKAQCQICRVELIATMPTVLRDHASNKHVKNTFEQCFPNLPV